MWTGWVFPFGYYPVIITALFVWGIHPDDPDESAPPVAFWLIMILGFIVVTALFILRVRHELMLEYSRRRKTVEMLRTSDTQSPEYVEVLRSAFVAFDTDDSGDISLQELREMLEIIFPDEARMRFAGVMKDVRSLASSVGATWTTTIHALTASCLSPKWVSARLSRGVRQADTFDEASFIDAVLLAVKDIRGLQGADVPHYEDKSEKKSSIMYKRSGTLRFKGIGNAIGLHSKRGNAESNAARVLPVEEVGQGALSKLPHSDDGSAGCA